jgi:hypothetical protein
MIRHFRPGSVCATMAEIVEVDFMAEQAGYKYLKPKAGSNYRQLFVNG